MSSKRAPSRTRGGLGALAFAVALALAAALGGAGCDDKVKVKIKVAVMDAGTTPAAQPTRTSTATRGAP